MSSQKIIPYTIKKLKKSLLMFLLPDTINWIQFQPLNRSASKEIKNDVLDLRVSEFPPHQKFVIFEVKTMRDGVFGYFWVCVWNSKIVFIYVFLIQHLKLFINHLLNHKLLCTRIVLAFAEDKTMVMYGYVRKYQK